MTYHLKVKFESSLRSHSIWIGQDIVLSNSFVQNCASLKLPLVIVSDASVANLYGQILVNFLQSAGLSAHLIGFSAGEEHKNRQTKEWIEDQLFLQRMGRDTALIALGGGVTTDLAGFVAATYCRGIPLIMVPTSLLAIVDASIGGKNGVDTPAGKNMIGTTYQPQAIFLDPTFLSSLPNQEIKNGLAEVIKHGLIASEQTVSFLEEQAQSILNLEMTVLEKMIYESCSIKRSIVEQDEQETGKRRLLNFGHTIAHALEIVSNYRIAHGKAVAIGMMAESYLSMQLGYLNTPAFDRIMALLHLYKLDLKIKEPLSPHALMQAMTRDKKATLSVPRFVLLEEIGKPLEFEGAFCSHVDEKALNHTLEWLCSVVYSN